MGPENALKSTGLMLASGDRARFDALAPELAKMTGKLVYLGPAPERAAGTKLLGNLFLVAVIAGLADTFGLAKALGIPPTDVAALFDSFNPGALVPARAKRMVDGGDFEHPSWSLAMARKDTRLMLEEAQRGGVSLAVIPAIAAAMDRVIAQGHSGDDWTVIAKDALTR
jgi:3-hydroxyisobutyrate dehydrogenase